MLFGSNDEEAEESEYEFGRSWKDKLRILQQRAAFALAYFLDAMLACSLASSSRSRVHDDATAQRRVHSGGTLCTAAGKMCGRVAS